MDLIGLFVAALAGGLTASFLYERVSVWWRARTTEQWPKTLNLRGARVTIFADGMMIYRRADGTLWAENLRFRDRHFKYAAQTEPADPRRELH